MNYSYNDYVTHSGEKLRLTDPTLFPQNNREWSVFARQFANKTNGIKPGETRQFDIFTADYRYVMFADGYMQGTILNKISLNDNDVTEDLYDDIYEDTSLFDGKFEGNENRQGNSNSSYSLPERNADSFYDELDQFIENHPQFFGNARKNGRTDNGRSEESDNEKRLTGQTTFSLRSTVEETRYLVAVHNMTTDQLQRSLDLGGLPMPSIAILKAQSGHARYGDISLVFDKSTIDPQESSKNKVYGGDAWTPVYPTVEIKVNKANQDKISAKHYELGRKYGYDAARLLYNYTNDAERMLKNEHGEESLLEKLYGDTDLMQLYRLDKGLSQIEPVLKVTRDTLSDAEVEQYDYIKNNFDLLDEVRELREKNAIRFIPWIMETKGGSLS